MYCHQFALKFTSFHPSADIVNAKRMPVTCGIDRGADCGLERV
jgi:hypothetical protein